MTGRILSVLALIFFLSPDVPARPPVQNYSKSTLTKAVSLLDTHIKRDERFAKLILNNTTAKEIRTNFKAGLNDLEYVIDQFRFYFSKRDQAIVGELERILAEERKEADQHRLSVRVRRLLRNMLNENLAVKIRLRDYAKGFLDKL